MSETKARGPFPLSLEWDTTKNSQHWDEQIPLGAEVKTVAFNPYLESQFQTKPKFRVMVIYDCADLAMLRVPRRFYAVQSGNAIPGAAGQAVKCLGGFVHINGSAYLLYEQEPRGSSLVTG